MLLAALAPVVTGCGMFKPDDPQPPDDSNPILSDYSSPEATLETLRQAIEAKAFRGGPTAYSGAFSDSSSNPNSPGYLQFFDLDDKRRYEISSGRPAPEPWYYLLEVNFFQKFINLRSDAYRMDWFPDPDRPDDPPIDPNDSFAEYHRRYLINADSEDGATSQIIAVGIAASCGNMLPIATGPNAVIYGTGRVPQAEMLRAGFVLNVLSGIVVFLSVRILCPLLGWT